MAKRESSRGKKVQKAKLKKVVKAEPKKSSEKVSPPEKSGLKARLANWSLMQFFNEVKKRPTTFAYVLLFDIIFFGVLVLINRMVQPYAAFVAAQAPGPAIHIQATLVSLGIVVVEVLIYALCKNVITNRLLGKGTKVTGYKRFVSATSIVVAIAWAIAVVVVIGVSQVAPVAGTTPYTVFGFVFFFLAIMAGIYFFIFMQHLHGVLAKDGKKPYKELIGDVFTMTYTQLGLYGKRLGNSLLFLLMYLGLYSLFGLGVKANYADHPLSLNAFAATYTLIFTIGLALVLYTVFSYLRLEFLEAGHKA